MDDRVIHDVLDILGKAQGSYAESFMALSLFLADYKHVKNMTKMLVTPKQTDGEKNKYWRNIIKI